MNDLEKALYSAPKNTPTREQPTAQPKKERGSIRDVRPDQSRPDGLGGNVPAILNPGRDRHRGGRRQPG